MKPKPNSEAPNETIALLRRLTAEKRETKRQMRQVFATNPDVQQALARLKQRNHELKSQSV